MRVQVGMALCASFWLTAAQWAQAAQIERVKDEVHITGELQADDEKRFEQALDGSVKLVEINSRGGDTQAALGIAKLVQQRELAVRAREVCADVCADLIFAASRHRSVTLVTVLGFAGSSRALALADAMHAWRRFCKAYATPDCQDLGDRLEASALQHDPQTTSPQLVGRAPWQGMDKEIALITKPPRDAYHMYVNVTDGKLNLNVRNSQLAKCRYWVPDNDGLKRFGLALENDRRYGRPLFAAVIREKLGLAEDDYYDGDLADFSAIKEKCGVSLKTVPRPADKRE